MPCAGVWARWSVVTSWCRRSGCATSRATTTRYWRPSRRAIPCWIRCGARVTPWTKPRPSLKNCPTSWWWWTSLPTWWWSSARRWKSSLPVSPRRRGRPVFTWSSRPSVRRWMWSPVLSRPTFRPASRSRYRARSIRVPSWIRGAPNPCSAWATCSTCRPVPPTRPGFTALSSMTTRYTRWWRTGNCAASRIISTRSSPESRAAKVAAANMAVVATKSSIPCSTRRWPSWWSRAAVPPPAYSASSRSVTTGRPVSSSRWKTRASSARRVAMASATCWRHHRYVTESHIILAMPSPGVAFYRERPYEKPDEKTTVDGNRAAGGQQPGVGRCGQRSQAETGGGESLLRQVCPDRLRQQGQGAAKGQRHPAGAAPQSL